MAIKQVGLGPAVVILLPEDRVYQKNVTQRQVELNEGKRRD